MSKLFKALLFLPLITGCKVNPVKEDSPNASQLQAGGTTTSAVETQDQLLFSLARFSKENKTLNSTLGKLSAANSEYLEIGSKDRFAVQTNLSLSTIANKGFLTKKSAINGGYWADAFVFGKQLGGSGKGALVDIGLDAAEDSMSLSGHIRYLGKEMLAGKLASKVERLLTRGLTDETLLYGSPLLGLKAGGNVGGEIGVKGDLDRSLDESMILGFTPRVGLNAGLTGKLEVLKFARAEVGGMVELVSSDITTQGSVSALRRLGLIMGDLGVDGGSFNALDGKVVIGASTGLEETDLPLGVDASLWRTVDFALQSAFAALLPHDADWKWVHVVWDPKPIAINKLPLFTAPFLSILDKKISADECEDRYQKLSAFVDSNSANIELLTEKVNEEYESREEEDEELAQRLRVLATVHTNYQTIKANMQRFCLSL